MADLHVQDYYRFTRHYTARKDLLNMKKKLSNGENGVPRTSHATLLTFKFDKSCFSNLTTKFGNLTVKFSFQFLKCRKIVCYFENKTRYQISGYQISLPLPPSLPPFLPASLCFSTSPLFTLSVYAQIGTVNMPHKRKDAEDFQTSF